MAATSTSPTNAVDVDDDSGGAAEQIVRQIEREAFAWLVANELVDATAALQVLTVDHHVVLPKIQWMALSLLILNAYNLHHEDESRLGLVQHLQTIVSGVAAGTQTTQQVDVPVEERRVLEAVRTRNRHEFQRAYVSGHAIPNQLEAYITTCATRCANDPARFRCPSIAIVQSSGFGKSRLLRELAKRMKDDATGPMKVLYVCVHTSDGTVVKYPEATIHLREYLFPTPTPTPPPGPTPASDPDENHARDLAARFVHLFKYAIVHWDSVGDEWFALFDDQSDATSCQQLQAFTPLPTCPRRLPRPRRLVLAIDEARALLQRHVQWFHVLRRALELATTTIRKTFGRSACVFVVLLDTNATMANCVPPVVHDASTRSVQRTDESAWFPPFVLTQTMDVRFRTLVQKAMRDGQTSVAFYQGIVQSDATTAWRCLVTMGRPAWDRTDVHNARAIEAPSDTIQRAADMLLGGRSAALATNLTDESLFGVASVLCRIGVRPSTWSPLAARAVGTSALAVYTNVSHDQYVTTFSSDPVLTFGAARVMYQSASRDDVHSTLSDVILPQFRKFLPQDVVDTGGIGEVVSRLVLLLTMDATGVVASNGSRPEWREYAGAFYSVTTFLRVLHGDTTITVSDQSDTDVSENRVEETMALTYRKDVQAKIDRWRAWTIGFSHFVQLSKTPDKVTLWAMLARRAAGIFPRHHKGVDLFIPMFRGKRVSFIFVHVTNGEAGDPSYPDSASTAMRPSLVFSKELKEYCPTDVVRIYMSLRGPDKETRKPFYLIDPGERRSDRVAGEAPSAKKAHQRRSYSLCLTGLQAWHARLNQRGKTVPVLSERVAHELQRMLMPWWEVLSLVNADIERRLARDLLVMRAEEIRASVSCTLISELLSYGRATPFVEQQNARAVGKRKRSDARSLQTDEDESDTMVDSTAISSGTVPTALALRPRKTPRR